MTATMPFRVCELPRYRRTALAACALAVACIVLALLPTSASAARCGPFTRSAVGADRHGGWAPGVGARVYTVFVNSYLQRCGRNVTRARHQIYFDTRAFPYGYRFSFSIKTRRSDGRWLAVTSRGWPIFTVSGRRRIQEVILPQLRTTYPPAHLTHVHVRHCACTLGGGVPVASTLRAAYRPFGGPQASPRR